MPVARSVMSTWVAQGNLPRFSHEQCKEVMDQWGLAWREASCYSMWLSSLMKVYQRLHIKCKNLA